MKTRNWHKAHYKLVEIPNATSTPSTVLDSLMVSRANSMGSVPSSASTASGLTDLIVEMEKDALLHFEEN